MPRTCTLLLVSTLLIAASIGCDRKATPAPAPAPAVTVAKSDIVGAWVMAPQSYNNAAFNLIKRKVEEKGLQMSPSEIDAQSKPVFEILKANPPSYSFADDGTFTATSHTMTITGTWSLEGDVLSLKAPDRDKPVTFKWWEGSLENSNDGEGMKPIMLVRKA